MSLWSPIRIRVISWLSVAVLSAAFIFGLASVVRGAGLGQAAPASIQVTGAGDAEFQIDPDPLPACTFTVSAEDSDPPTGSFDCQMSDDAVAYGIPFSHMAGDVTLFESLAQNKARLSGTATLDLPDGSQLEDVPYSLTVVPGEVDQGRLRIRLTGVFDGEPGDALPGNGDYDQWAQVLTDGSIEIGPPPSPSPSPSSSGSPSPTPSQSPTPTPSSTPSPTPTFTPTPTPSISISPPPPPSPPIPTPTFGPPSPPSIRDAPPPPGGANSTARLMALLAQLSTDGTPRLSDILAVVGPFPVAGLAWWTNDWHAYRCCPYPHLHQGLDMFAATGTPVVAAADGFVSQRVVDAISGLGVEITDAGGTQYFYAHLSSFATGLEVGQQVHLGQVLGYVGNTGNAIETSPHLHFEIQPGGVPEPPKPIVDGWLVIAEQKAEALVASRTGQAVLDPGDLAHWLALVRALQPTSTAADTGDQATIGGRAAHLAAPGDPPSAGAMLALASALLLILLVAPACVLGRREPRPAAAERPAPAQATAGARPSPSTPLPRVGPPAGRRWNPGSGSPRPSPGR